MNSTDDPGMTPPAGRDELEAMLPFYLNGTLGGDDLRRIEAWLESDPDAMAALGEAEAEFSATSVANEAIRPPADALARFQRSLDTVAGKERKPSESGFLQRFLASFAALPKQAAWGAAAALLAIVVAQAVLDQGPAPGGIELAGGENALADGPFVLVVFRDDATVAIMADALAKAGGSIVAGPLPGRMYRVVLPSADGAAYDEAAATLSAHPAVERLIAGRRPANAE